MDKNEILQKIDTIERKIAQEVRNFFPADLGNYTLEITDVTFTRPVLFDIKNEIKLKDNGASLMGKVSGDFQLKDKATGKVVKTATKTIASIPYLTNRGTYIIGGNEKVITKQMRLKPGVYTYPTKDGVESYMF